MKHILLSNLYKKQRNGPAGIEKMFTEYLSLRNGIQQQPQLPVNKEQTPDYSWLGKWMKIHRSGK